ncbi:DUF4328 domain-containing protein [Streptomyces noursei]|uniref:DUF4328 domain-containing protein n=1 Tax=Streptomyces noursei TaxID=1971 RepID=UPI001674097F|nr:DUF4328 domain-containing protein [Streptomyces noursei]MCZ1015433.1 DUF4328 domain-containing protein [Streptomyces noursei]
MSHLPGAPSPSPSPSPPPGWSAPQAPQAVLRSPVGLSKAVMILLGLVIVTDAFAVWQGNHWYQLSGRLLQDIGSVTSREISAADTLYRASGIMQDAASVATAVLFVVWFHRTRVNAEVFAPDGHEKKRGWAIWGWLVPVVNLWFPRRIALDIWDASADRNSRSTALLNWWWALWVANLLVGRVAGRFYARAEGLREIRGAIAGLMASDLVDIAAAVLAAFFVLRLTRMQHEKALRGPGSAA